MPRARSRNVARLTQRNTLLHATTHSKKKKKKQIIVSVSRGGARELALADPTEKCTHRAPQRRGRESSQNHSLLGKFESRARHPPITECEWPCPVDSRVAAKNKMKVVSAMADHFCARGGGWKIWCPLTSFENFFAGLIAFAHLNTHTPRMMMMMMRGVAVFLIIVAAFGRGAGGPSA